MRTERRTILYQTLLVQTLETLKTNYESLLKLLEHLKADLPSGSLRIQKLNGIAFYSRRLMDDGHQIQIAIPISHPDGKQLIKELIEKRIVNHGLPIIRNNIKILEKTIEQFKHYSPEDLLPASTYKEILDLGILIPDNLFLPDQLNTEKWIADTRNNNYRTNPFHPEQRVFETTSGHIVRSKSELQIDDHLYYQNLIYRYESELWLPIGKTIYPDFTVLHPTENRLIFIEHFGRMDDPDYAMYNALRRLMDYARSGYILGRDVFFTMESLKHPLNRNQILDTLNLAGLIL